MVAPLQRRMLQTEETNTLTADSYTKTEKVPLSEINFDLNTSLVFNSALSRRVDEISQQYSTLTELGKDLRTL